MPAGGRRRRPERAETGAGGPDRAADRSRQLGTGAVETGCRAAQEDAGELATRQRVGDGCRHGVVGSSPGEAPAALGERRWRGLAGVAAVGEGRREVEVLEHEVAPLDHRCVGDRPAAQVEMQGAHHVDAGGVVEEAELRTDAGVEVEQLVTAVAAVEAPVEVGDAAVADRGAEPSRQLAQLVVLDGAPPGRHPCVGRPGAQLEPGEGDTAPPVSGQVGVHDPVLGHLGRDVLLQQHAVGL